MVFLVEKTNSEHLFKEVRLTSRKLLKAILKKIRTGYTMII
jgi:hypothetical protein